MGYLLDTISHNLGKLMQIKLIRGVPGAGKTTLATKNYIPYGFKHFEAHMYFVKNGVYKWFPSGISDAHNWCQVAVVKAMIEGRNIVVSNTFTRISEMEFYLKVAEKFGYNIEVIRCTAQFDNIHNVPQDKVKAMLERFEDYPSETIYKLS
jgi:predicted kinase